MATKTTTTKPKAVKANSPKVEAKKTVAVEKLEFKTEAELKTMAIESKKLIAKTMLSIKAGRETNTRRVFNERKHLARVLTALSAKKALNKI